MGLRANAGAEKRTWGYDLTLIAELNLNDIKGVRAPSLDAWSTAASLAAVTTTLELMVAVRPVDLLLLQCSPQLERWSGSQRR